MGYRAGGASGDIAFAVLVEGGGSSSTAVGVTDAFLGALGEVDQFSGRPGKARVTGVWPAAAQWPVASLSAAEVRAVGWRVAAGQTPVTRAFPGLPEN